MAESESELLARIDALSGKINEHKQAQQSTGYSHTYQYQSSRGRGRWSPYGRGGRAGYQAHRNRTLVLNGIHTPPSGSDTVTPAGSSLQTDQLVSTRGIGKHQLMNKDTYDRQQKDRLEQKEKIRATKMQRVNIEERSRLIQHADSISATNTREVVIDGIRFQLREDGSKLMRVSDPTLAMKETPKKLQIADVDFIRTKHGNLVRANAVKGLNRPARTERPQCENFTKDGSCRFGPTCHFSHDPQKVAVCKTLLQTGACAADGNCDLSHDLTYHRVPACNHFLRGNCTNRACPYPHIHVSPSAPVCRRFATLGYCDNGEECAKRHVFECPDYGNHGYCANRENGTCLLPHTDRASTLRKAAARQAKIDSGKESDMSSDEEQQQNVHLDDIDSDEAEDVMMGGTDDGSLTQQNDYVPFS